MTVAAFITGYLLIGLVAIVLLQLLHHRNTRQWLPMGPLDVIGVVFLWLPFAIVIAAIWVLDHVRD